MKYANWWALLFLVSALVVPNTKVYNKCRVVFLTSTDSPCTNESFIIQAFNNKGDKIKERLN